HEAAVARGEARTFRPLPVSASAVMRRTRLSAVRARIPKLTTACAIYGMIATDDIWGEGIMGGWIILGIIAAIVLWAIAIYNRLVGAKNQVSNSWAQIDVQLKRRHDLIPNLVEVVKDAMGYEQETLKQVIEARNRAVSASGPAEAGPA